MAASITVKKSFQKKMNKHLRRRVCHRKRNTIGQSISGKVMKMNVSNPTVIHRMFKSKRVEGMF